MSDFVYLMSLNKPEIHKKLVQNPCVSLCSLVRILRHLYFAMVFLEKDQHIHILRRERCPFFGNNISCKAKDALNGHTCGKMFFLSFHQMSGLDLEGGSERYLCTSFWASVRALFSVFCLATISLSTSIISDSQFKVEASTASSLIFFW